MSFERPPPSMSPLPAGATPFPASASMSAVPAGAAPRLGRYLVIGELGRGGMGVVYRAHDPGLQREVAIKVLETGPGGPPDERLVQRFVREARAAARLAHAGIVGVFEVGDHGGRPFMVMELVDGRALDRVLAEGGPLEPRRAAGLGAELARALAHAHEHGIVHRDVKPANVLLAHPPEAAGLDPAARAAATRERGRARLTDFGLAADPSLFDERLTTTGQMLGTPQYMAPEQVGAQRGTTGPSTDVYGLGGVLFHALAGRPPFEAGDIVGLLRLVMTADPPALRELNPAVHRDLETIVVKCLEKSPDRRYASALELAADLERFGRGEPIGARPPSRLERARRWIRRNRGTAAALSLVAAAALFAAGAGGFALLAVRRRVAADRAAFVEQARSQARADAEAFEQARSAVAPSGESDEQARARQEQALALGLRAFSSAMVVRTLDLEDEQARRDAFAIAMANGEVALRTGQWSLAASAFDEAIALDVDRARAEQGRARVETERRRVADARRAEVERILEQAGEGELARRSDGYRDALFALVRYPEAQTVEQLGAALDRASARARDVVREAYAGVVEPDAAERQAGGERIDGLAAAVEELLERLPDEELFSPAQEALEAADRRLLTRRGRAAADRGGLRATARALLAVHQERVLGHELDRARLCAEALGRIGIRDGAVGPLCRYALAERDPLRAVVPAIALCSLGGAEARRTVLALLEAHRANGTFVRRVSGHLRRLDGDHPIEEPVAVEHARRARLREAIGDLDGARRDYDRAIELAPEQAVCWRRRGEVRARAGDLEGAFADLERAIELGPDDALGFLARATVNRRARKLDAALADVDRAIELSPRDATLWVTRGEIRAIRGPHESALADADRAIELDRGNAAAWGLRGRMLWRLDREEEAVAAYSRAIDLSPESAVYLNDRGALRSRLGDLDGALADLNRALELDPTEAAAYCNRGLVKRRRGDREGAEADYDRAIEIDPRQKDALNNRAVMHLDRGDTTAAIADLTAALAAEPHYVLALANRARAYREAGQIDLALADCDAGLRLEPNRVDLLAARGALRRQKGDHEGALRDVERALELEPGSRELLRARAELRRASGAGPQGEPDRADAGASDDPGGRIARARLLAQRGEVEAARAELDRALELDPGHVQTLIARGRLRAEAGDPEGALADLGRAIELAPDMAAAWGARADMRFNAGQSRLAIADYDRALELDRDNAYVWSFRGAARVKVGDVAGGLADALRAVELEPGYALGWFHVGEARRDSDDVAAAISAWTRAIELEPRMAIAYNNRGVQLGKLGRHDEALADFERATELRPGLAPAWENLGGQWERRGEVGKAREAFGRLLKLLPPGRYAERVRAKLRELEQRR